MRRGSQQALQRLQERLWWRQAPHTAGHTAQLAAAAAAAAAAAGHTARIGCTRTGHSARVQQPGSCSCAAAAAAHHMQAGLWTQWMSGRSRQAGCLAPAAALTGSRPGRTHSRPAAAGLPAPDSYCNWAWERLSGSWDLRTGCSQAGSLSSTSPVQDRLDPVKACAKDSLSDAS